jgi:hypothetical protein
MEKKTQRRKTALRAVGRKDSSPKAIGSPYSPRSQKNVREQWRLERELATCNGQIGLWERKLKTAQEGVTRQTAQVSAGQGVSHSILQSYVKEVTEAKEMVASFKEQAAALHAQIDALMPDAAKAAERAEGQKTLAGQFRTRLELDRTLDFALESVGGILTERAALTSKMRAAAESLEFSHGLDLDGQRFEALLRILPGKMAAESEKFVRWFLGEDGERRPCVVQGGEVVLDETLRNHNAFRTGDCPNLTKEEESKIERILASRGPFAPEVEPTPMRMGEPAQEVPPEKIQWALLR